MKELLYAVECTTDGGRTWSAICVDAMTAIHVNEFVMQFLPECQGRVRITECTCKSCEKYNETAASTWIMATLGIDVFFTIDGEGENIFRFSYVEHAEEVAALLKARDGDRRYDVVMIRC